MLWAIHCVDKPNSTDLRMSLRPAHLDYLKQQNALIVLAGATLTDDGETMTGSAFVIEAESRAAAEAFSANDPFTKGGLFGSITIGRMRKGIWNPDHMPAA
ncbi:MAG: YciI family protein [Alphaproteobacteria bacterium]